MSYIDGNHNNCNSRIVVVQEPGFLPNLPLEYVAHHDVDANGDLDLRAKYPLTPIDRNGNNVLDQGDEVHIGSPTLMPVSPDSPMAWCPLMYQRDAMAIAAAINAMVQQANEFVMID